MRGYMERIAEFQKVSFEQFAAAMKDIYGESRELERVYAEITLPRRATAGSAGYDFRSTVSVTLAPGETAMIPTGIRVRIDEGWALLLFPRSGLGFRYRLQLNNTVGVIDSDYYGSDNEGHIFIKVTNDSNEGKTCVIERGSAFAQGIFMPFGITADDDASEIRNGGFGSTSR